MHQSTVMLKTEKLQAGILSYEVKTITFFDEVLLKRQSKK